MITVTPLQLLGQDDRGSNFSWLTDRTGEFLLCYRHAGSSSGQHYHTGASANKNPEVMYLLNGQATLHWCTLNDITIHTVIATAPARIEVPANIWHQLIAVTDCTFIELNTVEDVRNDSIRIWKEDLEKTLMAR
ncbi:hypothetical protein KTO58_06595 [Chitinophaga pendula]|uniref:hypothetical protein n=1 Tax=Chitinophaga TaxID=79328 RepID=UPI000BAFA9AC|nr:MULTISPECIES: hypothetical protein [Chitinophaga]ASZ13518.1 hypothetical protein CK934_22465 [Chitinophaga sp. MD30]UCJ08851.1 hypothetical protein KTO58_06595 [Chitinophaga pendula]